MRPAAFSKQTKAMNKSFIKSYDTVEWQKKKYRILVRDNFTCQLCGRKDGRGHALQVHHLSYDRCAQRRCYVCPDEDLITLCKECHNAIHNPPHVYEDKEGYEVYLDNDDIEILKNQADTNTINLFYNYVEYALAERFDLWNIPYIKWPYRVKKINQSFCEVLLRMIERKK